MPFMEEEILDKDYVFEVDTNQGIFYIPSSVVTPPPALRHDFSITEDSDPWIFEKLCEWCNNYVPGGKEGIYEITIRYGYLGRYQAPGYMDATDWSFSKNFRELRKDLKEMYGE